MSETDLINMNNVDFSSLQNDMNKINESVYFYINIFIAQLIIHHILWKNCLPTMLLFSNYLVYFWSCITS